MKINVNVKIEVGKKEFSLTPEEMIELRDKLIELTDYDVSQPVILPDYYPTIYERSYPVPIQPYIGDPLPENPWNREYTITCNTLQ